MLGRINVSKTFLVSQLSYLGPIINLDADWLSRLEKLVNNYLLRGMPYDKKKLYASPSKGGLGLINLKTLFVSLKCSWAGRLVQGGANDSWRYNILSGCHFDLRCLRPEQFTDTRPLEKNICRGIWQFLQSFWQKKNNILYSPVFCNPLIIRGWDENGRLDKRQLYEGVIGIDHFLNNAGRLLSVRVIDLVDGPGVKHYDAFCVALGLRINFNAYLSIRRALQCVLRKVDSDAGTRLAQDFMNFIKVKGSRKFRRVLDEHITMGKNLWDNCMTTFTRLTGTAKPTVEQISGIIGYWNKSYLPISIRMFLFQLYNNSLPVKARVYHRTNNQGNAFDQGCKICSNGYNVPLRETFNHLYFDCTTTTGILNRYIEKYNMLYTDEIAIKNLVFYGIKLDGTSDEISYISSILLLYSIWQFRNTSNRINFLTIEENMMYLFNGVVKCNKRIENMVITNDNTWCRNWRCNWQQGRG